MLVIFFCQEAVNSLTFAHFKSFHPKTGTQMLEVRRPELSSVSFSVPDFVGKLLLWLISVPQLPAENCDKDQQDEDEEQRTHDGADDHAGSVWSWMAQRTKSKKFEWR